MGTPDSLAPWQCSPTQLGNCAGGPSQAAHIIIVAHFLLSYTRITLNVGPSRHRRGLPPFALMTNQNKGANSPLPAWLLHHVTRRRNRVYGAFGVALVLLAVATWIYGGFATGIDFTTSVPRPPGQFAPAKADATSTTTSTATSIAPSTDGATGAATSTNGVTAANDDATDTNGTDGATSITVATTTNSANGANGHQTQTAPVDQETSAADDDWRHSTHNPAAHVSPGIPPKIWQILLPKNSTHSDDFVPNPKSLDNTASWLAMNTDYA